MSYIQGNPWLAGGEEASGIGNALSTVLLRVPQIRAQIAMQQQQMALAQQELAIKQGEFGLQQQRVGPEMALQTAQARLANTGADQGVFNLQEAKSNAQYGDMAGQAMRGLVLGRQGPLATAPTLTNQANPQQYSANMGMDENFQNLAQASGHLPKDSGDMITALQRLMAMRQQGGQFDPQSLNALMTGSHIQPQQPLHAPPGSEIYRPNTAGGLDILGSVPNRPYSIHDMLPTAINAYTKFIGTANAPTADPSLMQSGFYQDSTNNLPQLLNLALSKAGLTNNPGAPALNLNGPATGSTDYTLQKGTMVVKIIKTKADFDALPKGAKFSWNGREGTKQ